MKTVVSSIQVGMPQFFGDPNAIDPEQKAWFSGFNKRPVSGPIKLTDNGLDGDGQADLVHHGGRDKAILCYSAQHSDFWKAETGRKEIAGGLFGENLTLENGTEEVVCVGDQFSIGAVVVEVSQPRQPCWKLGRYWSNPLMPKLVVKHGFCGWYLRVVQSGEIATGMPFELLHRPNPDWSIRRAHVTMYAKKSSTAFQDRSELARLPELSDSWRSELES